MRYVDSQTGERLSSQYGRCDRERNCGYQLKPDRQQLGHIDTLIPLKPMPPKPTSFIDLELMTASVKQGFYSTFAQWMLSLFGEEIFANAAKQYHLGASKHWNGATVFWQVDSEGKIRTGKVMLYDETGHRVKEPRAHVSWVHSILSRKDYHLKQCFFGEHLLNQRPEARVAIVESEKTAVIASIYIPEMVWIATGGKNGCRWKNDASVHQVLKNRNVVLFPDLGAYSEWSEIANNMIYTNSVSVSTLLEENADDSETESGLDIADYLVRFGINQFIPTKEEPIAQEEVAEVIEEEQVEEKTTLLDWASTIDELEQFYGEIELPERVMLDSCTPIKGVLKFINAHMLMVKSNIENATFLPYLTRLIQLKTSLEQVDFRKP